MLREMFCHYVIVGHSERRQYFGETDETSTRRPRPRWPPTCAHRLHRRDAAERESGRTEEVITTQVRASLAGMSPRELKECIAYEPVWAIGTGKTATPRRRRKCMP
jgi:triosephosphate isomerase